MFVELESLTDADLESLDKEFHTMRQKKEASAAIEKLHTNISAEKKRRYSLRSAEQAIGSIFKTSK